MNQQEIDRISAFIKEVNQLPDEILTSDEADAFIDENLNQEYTQKVYDNQKQLFGKVQDVKIRLLAYFRAISGETSAYIELIGEITFKTKGYILNTIHLKNNEAWIEDKTKLLNILKMAKAEFEEKKRIAEYNPENSLKSYFKTKEARGIALTAFLSLITTLIVGIATKDIWWSKLFPTSNLQKNFTIIDSNEKIKYLDSTSAAIAVDATKSPPPHTKDSIIHEPLDLQNYISYIQYTNILSPYIQKNVITMARQFLYLSHSNLQNSQITIFYVASARNGIPFSSISEARTVRDLLKSNGIPVRQEIFENQDEVEAIATHKRDDNTLALVVGIPSDTSAVVTSK